MKDNKTFFSMNNNSKEFYKDWIQSGIQKANNRFDGFSSDYFNALCKRINACVGKKVALDFETKSQAETFGLHIKFYDQVTTRLKEMPVVHFYPEYDAIYIEEKSESLCHL